MSLRDLQRRGWLKEHRPSRQETEQLLKLVDRDLADCRTTDLSTDWRFNIAYNAALQAATAALAACGFRASREFHHQRTIASLTHTLGVEIGMVQQLDAFRRKRNRAGYDLAGGVSDQEAEEMATLAGELRSRLQTWLRADHPQLIGGSA